MAGSEVRILYRNWRGEVAVRTIQPEEVWYGSTNWHPEPQWLLDAIDLDNPYRRVKCFAMSGILAWGDEAIAAYQAATGVKLVEREESQRED